MAVFPKAIVVRPKLPVALGSLLLVCVFFFFFFLGGGGGAWGLLWLTGYTVSAKGVRLRFFGHYKVYDGICDALLICFGGLGSVLVI